MKNSTRAAVAVGSALLLSSLPVGSAEAAGDISVGGSCKLSANWKVTVSANFNDTHGSPSRGFLDYVVISSPGYLIDTLYSAYNGSYEYSRTSFSVSSGPPYVFRSDPNQENMRWVRFEVGNENASCTVTVYAKN